MGTAGLIREARKRAGLTQAELAARIRRPQSTVARWEAQRRTPSLEVLREVADACGLELTVRFAKADNSYDWFIARQLELPPAERLATMSAGYDVLPLLRALHARQARCVLIGEVAAVLQGCPLTLDRRTSAIVPGGDAVSEHALAAALQGLGAVRGDIDDRFCGLHAVEPWTLPDASTVEVVHRPAGTHGYADLCRDARAVALLPDLQVTVASVADLARIADASPRPVDRAWLAALRTLAERAADRDGARRA